MGREDGGVTLGGVVQDDPPLDEWQRVTVAVPVLIRAEGSWEASAGPPMLKR
jgi:hypothetical protein